MAVLDELALLRDHQAEPGIDEVRLGGWLEAPDVRGDRDQVHRPPLVGRPPAVAGALEHERLRVLGPARAPGARVVDRGDPRAVGRPLAPEPDVLEPCPQAVAKLGLRQLALVEGIRLGVLALGVHQRCRASR